LILEVDPPREESGPGLRALLGSVDVVVQRDERVALAPERVFVDAWALGRLLDQLESARTCAPRARLREYRCNEVPDAKDEDPLLGDLRRRLGERVERAWRARD
jgi:hypothetical protein